MKCWVCGIAPHHLVDVNPRAGLVVVQLSFGQNALEGKVTETWLLGYAIFLTDVFGNRVLNNPVQTVPVDTSLSSTICCQEGAYSTTIGLTLPAQMQQFRFEIVPVTKSTGALPAGLLTQVILDSNFNGVLSSDAQGAVLDWVAWPIFVVALLPHRARS